MWKQQRVEKRPGEQQRKPLDPQVVHEFYPSRKPDDDTCAICGREFDDRRHPPIPEDDLTDSE